MISRWSWKLFLSWVLLMISFGFCIWLCLYLAEHYFFDRLLFHKSVLHGYGYRRILPNSPAYNLPQRKFVRWLNGNREAGVEELLQPAIKNDLSSQKVVVIISDSFGYGVGVRADQRFTQILTKLIQRKYPTIKVVSLNEPSNSIVDYFTLYQLAQDRFHPIATIITGVENDLLFNLPYYPQTDTVQRILEQKCIGPLYETHFPADITKVKWHDYVTEAWLSFSPAFRNRCYLQAIAQELSQDPKLLYFLFEPPKQPPQSNPEWSIDDDLYHAAGTQYAQELAVSGVETLIYEYQVGDKFISNKELHPSPLRHQHIAEQLMAKLTYLGWLEVAKP